MAAQPFRGAHRHRGGFTVIEATVAGAIITLFLTSIFALNSNMIHMLRSASETANASQDLQTRVEQIRLANWTQITDPTWFTGTNSSFFNKTDALINLTGMSETVTVSAYADPASATPTSTLPPFTITHGADGSITSDSPNYAYTSNLQGQEMIRIDLSVNWPSLHRNRKRSLTTLVSRWGISK